MYLFKQVNNIETHQIESDIKREAFEKKQKKSWQKYLSTYQTIKKIAGRSSSIGRFMIIDGTTAYHSSLIEKFYVKAKTYCWKIKVKADKIDKNN